MHVHTQTKNPYKQPQMPVAESFILTRKDPLQTHRSIVLPVTIYNGTLGMNTSALMHRRTINQKFKVRHKFKPTLKTEH